VKALLYWAGVFVAVGLVATGVTVAVLGYADTAGPEGAVRGDVAALVGGDAPTALAYGPLPAGSHSLLTREVLREQQRVAPLQRVTIEGVHRHGDTAEVAVKYLLAFPDLDLPVSAQVPVHKSSGQWRLDRVAIPVRLRASEGSQRQSILGGPVPTGAALLFPGALPISLDTRYLELDPTVDTVAFDSPSLININLAVSAAGRAAFTRATLAKVRTCVTGAPDPACPLPDERYVPGSVHGSVDGGVRDAEVTLVPADGAGTMLLNGRVSVDGTYQRLDFHNRQLSGHGRIDISVHAISYAVAPVQVRWASS
jgi:hypothetical protein